MEDYQKYIEDKMFHRWVFDRDPEAERFFEEQMRLFPEKKETLLRLRDEFRFLEMSNEKPDVDVKKRVFEKIGKQMDDQKHQVRMIQIRNFLKYAAVAVLFFLTGALAVYTGVRSSKTQPFPESLLVKGAAMNTTVYLADGRQKEISDPAVLLDFSDPGRLIVGADTIFLNPEQGGVEFRDVVVVPYGKRAKLKLQDNSLVFLSSGSRLIVPEKYEDTRRDVYLVGEAFFEVSKNKRKPFFVETLSARVKVLGTKFNVSAYPDQSSVSAFLQEGKVLFRKKSENFFDRWVELSPADQVVFNKKSDNITVKKADPVYYQLWKEGIISFDNQPVNQLLRKVEQYFNITIRLKDTEKGEQRISGKLDVNRQLDEILEYIEKITDKKIMKADAGEYILS